MKLAIGFRPAGVERPPFGFKKAAENGLIGLADGRKIHAKRAFRTLKLAHFSSKPFLDKSDFNYLINSKRE